jgi:hypothetical protein
MRWCAVIYCTNRAVDYGIYCWWCITGLKKLKKDMVKWGITGTVRGVGRKCRKGRRLPTCAR